MLFYLGCGGALLLVFADSSEFGHDTSISFSMVDKALMVGVSCNKVDELRPRVPNITLSNNQTYQSGKLRDLETVQFKLNSVDNEHDFTPIFEPPRADMFLDQSHDMILIKLHGRQQNAGPTQLM